MLDSGVNMGEVRDLQTDSARPCDRSAQLQRGFRRAGRGFSFSIINGSGRNQDSQDPHGLERIPLIQIIAVSIVSHSVAILASCTAIVPPGCLAGDEYLGVHAAVHEYQPALVSRHTGTAAHLACPVLFCRLAIC